MQSDETTRKPITVNCGKFRCVVDADNHFLVTLAGREIGMELQDARDLSECIRIAVYEAVPSTPAEPASCVVCGGGPDDPRHGSTYHGSELAGQHEYEVEAPLEQAARYFVIANDRAAEPAVYQFHNNEVRCKWSGSPWILSTVTLGTLETEVRRKRWDEITPAQASALLK